MHWSPGYGDARVEVREVVPAELVPLLRYVVGLAFDEPAPGEQSAMLWRSLPKSISGFDAGGWVCWCVVGLFVFADGFPTMLRVRREAKRFAIALAMVRSRGSINAAAKALGIGRGVLRDHLQKLGLYPWPGVDGEPRQR